MARTLMAHSPGLPRTDHGPNSSFYAKSTLDSWNYPWLELFFMVPSLFEPLKFYSNFKSKRAAEVRLQVAS